VDCKYCQSSNTVKYGFKGKTQYYKCKDCGRKFAGRITPEGMRFPSTIISESLALFQNGLSPYEISRHLIGNKGVFVHPTSIWRWVIRYSRNAVGKLNNIQMDSYRWFIDETVEKIAGQDIWIWDVIDYKTGFIITTHASLTKNPRSTIEILSEAQSRTLRVPDQIISPKMKIYPNAIENVFGSDGTHIVINDSSDDSSVVEKFRSVIKERRRIIKRLRKVENVRIILNGFIVYYNFFRPQQVLDLQTPGHKAGLTITRFDEE
jgi:putative transposase